MRIAVLASLLGLVLGGGPGATANSASTGANAGILVERGVRPLDARHSPFIDGNVSPHLPTGHAGRIDVIAVGRYDRATELLPFVVRNNRRRTADKIEVGAFVFSRSGALLETDPPNVLFPTVLEPGEIAFGVFSVRREYVPAGARFVFRFVQDPGLEVLSSDLHVTDTALVNGRVAGTARNAGNAIVSGPIGEGVLCITPAGVILRYRGGERHTSLQPGEKVRFRVPLRGQACPTFLVGAQGF
jgi:hypothetical protein